MQQAVSAGSAADQVRPRVVEVYGKHPFPKRTDEGARLINERVKEKFRSVGLPLEQFRGKRVLDGGCGTGELACLMASYGAQVTGIEISPASLDYARRYAQRQGVSVNIIEGSLLEYPFEPASFDIISLHMSIPCVADPARAIQNVAKALKPGGYLFICVFTKWGKLLFSEVPQWRYRLVRWLGRNNPERCERIGERLFYTPGMERKHGLPKDQYLADAWGIPIANLNTYGEVLRWFRDNGVEYRSSYPAMEFATFIKPFLDSNRRSATFLGGLSRGLLRAVLTVLPMHRLPIMQRPSWISRGMCQAALLMTGCHAMFNVLGQKRSSLR